MVYKEGQLCAYSMAYTPPSDSYRPRKYAARLFSLTCSDSLMSHPYLVHSLADRLPSLQTSSFLTNNFPLRWSNSESVKQWQSTRVTDLGSNKIFCLISWTSNYFLEHSRNQGEHSSISFRAHLQDRIFNRKHVCQSGSDQCSIPA